MKNIIISTLFAALCFTAAAQQQEAVGAKQKTVTDSVKVVTGRYYVPDSIRTAKPAKGKTKTVTTLVAVNPKNPTKENPSKLTYTTTVDYIVASDSLHQLKKGAQLRADSQYRNAALFKIQSDTSRRKKSIMTQRVFELQKDSAHNAQQKHKLALSKKVYEVQIKYDSAQLKKYLEHKKNAIFRLALDSAHIKTGFRIKKLYISMPCTEADTIFIKNSYRRIQVFTNGGTSMSASTKLAYKDSIKASDEILMSKLGVSFKRNGKNITAVINGINPKQVAENDEYKEILQNEMNAKSTVSITVPVNVVVVINTINAEVNVENYVKNFKTEITNGALILKSADDATIKGSYSTITAGTIKNADVTMHASSMNASTISAMKVTSSSSTLKLKECNSLDVTQSTSDAIVVDKAVNISGNKNFGKLTVIKLEGKLSLSGTGSSIAVNSLSKGTPQVAINSKYADVKLPLSTLPDYAVYYEGSFNDVSKTSTVTQQLNSLSKLNTSLTVQKDTLSLDYKNKNIAKTILKANAGNTNGEHTKIDIVCPYCNVVFY